MKVDAKAIGFKELQQQLKDVSERGGDPRPAFREVAELFRDDQRATYARGGRPKWKPLSPKYAAQKAREGRTGGVGVYTGAMRDSFTKAGDAYNLEVVRNDRLRVGSTLPTANLFGGKHKTRKQPRRRPFSLTPSRRREYLEVVQDYLTSGRS